jgi:hypothetical protein
MYHGAQGFSRRARQPTGQHIDISGADLGVGLASAYVFHPAYGLRDLTNRSAQGTLTGNAAFRAGEGGIGVGNFSTTSDYIAMPSTSISNAMGSKWTMMIVLQNGTTGNQGFGQCGAAGATEAYPYSGSCLLTYGASDRRGVTPTDINWLLRPHATIGSIDASSVNGTLSQFVRGTSASAIAYTAGNFWTTGARLGSTPALSAYTGIFYGFFIWSRPLNASECWALTENPWQMFRLRSPRIYFMPAAAGGNVTVALTGQSTSLSTGTLQAANAVALSGLAQTGSAGTLVPGTAVGLTGLSESATPGAFGPTDTVALSGQGGSASTGTLVGGVAIGMVGQALTGSAGALAPSDTVALTGVSATFSQGTVTPNISSGNDVTVGLTGQSLAATAGVLAPSTTVGLSGQSAGQSQGNLGPNPSVSAIGQALTSSSGALAPSTSVGLSGQQSNLGQGSVAVAGDVTVALSGIALNLALGNLSIASGTGADTHDFAPSIEDVRRYRRTREEVEKARRRRWNEEREEVEQLAKQIRGIQEAEPEEAPLIELVVVQRAMELAEKAPSRNAPMQAARDYDREIAVVRAQLEAAIAAWQREQEEIEEEEMDIILGYLQ